MQMSAMSEERTLFMLILFELEPLLHDLHN